MFEINKRSLLKKGIHFGSLTKKLNSTMISYIHKKNEKIYLLNIKKIISSCLGLNNYIKKIIEEKKNILFLCTDKKSKKKVKLNAIKCGMPYIVNKWQAGFLTNFEIIKFKLRELNKLINVFQKEDRNHLLFTKKQKMILEKRKKKLLDIYEGVIDLKKIPDILFIIGLNDQKNALQEAKKMNIPIIAVCNTNCNSKMIDYIIPGNDNKKKSIDFFSNLISEIILNKKKC